MYPKFNATDVSTMHGCLKLIKYTPVKNIKGLPNGRFIG